MAERKGHLHVHKFKRHVYESGYTIFFCTLPNCNYKVKKELTLGKLNVCWRCGKEFTMNEYALRLAKPHCPDCQKDRSGKPLPKTEITTKYKFDIHRGETNATTNLRQRLLSTIGESIRGTPTEKDDLL